MKGYLAQLFTILLLGLLAGFSYTANANETTQQIREAVNTYVDLRLKNMADHPQFKNSTNIQVKIGRLDSRLKLAACNEHELRVDDHSGSPLGGRYLLKASCTGKQIWSLFVPVSISVTKPVVVAISQVPRGTTLQAHHLQLVDWEVSSLKYGYLDSLQQAVGRQLRRPLSAGKPVLPDHLGTANVVKKGDEVLIEASKGLISVKSPGIALSSGGIGEQINVRNSRSKKVIRATIVQSGRVEVQM